ncbi:MAG: hypothetical protein CMB62_00165 [Euryarchaeota archaeon]|nr:hypothetical protein [Euryarchaeota archaeon]
MKLPYTLRRNQQEIIDTIKKGLCSKNHLVIEAPTGSGKTFTSLASALPFALVNDCRIIYCVRTNSQQEQVIRELKEFKKSGNNISAVAIQGRQSMCPQQKDDSELAKSNWSEKSKICKSLKMQSKMGEAGCPYYRKLLRPTKKLLETWSSEIYNAEEFTSNAEKEGLCPYELNKLLLKKAQVVIVPYVYFFEDFIRKYLLGWMDSSIDKIVTIVDEAHNLPDWSRDAASDYLSLDTLRSASKESEKFGLLLGDGSPPSFFLDLVESALKSLSEYHIPEEEEEGLLPSHIVSLDSEVPTFETEMMSLGKMTLYRLKQQSSDLSKMGQLIRQTLLEKGKRPRSYLGSVGDFLCRWLDSIESHSIRLVGKKPLRLEKVCLDPRVMTGFLDETAGVIMMSGTLSPLDMFRDLVGLKPESILERYDSIFPKENRLVRYVNDVTTSYRELNNNPKVWIQLVDKLESIINKFSGNIALFFPSYKTLESALNELKLSKPIYKEYSGMNQEELMNTVESFKSDSGSVLAGVMGGRLAEGIDYPDTSLEMAIIVGVPYPSPGVRQEALQHYFDVCFNGKGWEYAVESPALRKMLQAAGRVIRSENDKGMIIITDGRAGKFSENIPDLELSNDIIHDIGNFFEA